MIPPCTIPSLDKLAEDPRLAANLPMEMVPSMLCRLAAVQTALAARLVVRGGNGQHVDGNGNGVDRLLRVKDAAEMLAMTEDYLRRKANELPFTVRPAPRQLRFSLHGIERFIRQRKNL